MRRFIFWVHFVAGMIAGLFILSMSVTGVLLTYERQMVSAAENAAVDRSAAAAPLSISELIVAAEAQGAVAGNRVTLPRDREHVVEVSKGRRDSFLLDPFSGEVLEGAGEKTHAFFSRVTAIHRWLAFTGQRNETAAALNAAANVVFGLLLLTGAVLWWPKIWKWGFIKTQLFFRRGLSTPKARHYNWHHVLAVWTFIPLIVIVFSGMVFSYGWANALVFAAFGEKPAARGGPPPAPTVEASVEIVMPGDLASYDVLVDQAVAAAPSWKRVSFALPEPATNQIEMMVDWGNGVQPEKQETVTLARDGSGRIGGEETVVAQSPASKARRFLRFAHTGEVYGWIGQTIAGLTSLASVILVYTGLSLAIRRLLRMRAQARARRTKPA